MIILLKTKFIFTLFLCDPGPKSFVSSAKNRNGSCVSIYTLICLSCQCAEFKWCGWLLCVLHATYLTYEPIYIYTIPYFHFVSVYCHTISMNRYCGSGPGMGQGHTSWKFMSILVKCWWSISIFVCTLYYFTYYYHAL